MYYVSDDDDGEGKGEAILPFSSMLCLHTSIIMGGGGRRKSVFCFAAALAVPCCVPCALAAWWCSFIH